MSIYALQSPAGGFLDEELKRFNKEFDDWCIQFDNFEDASIIAQSLDKKRTADVVEITPLSYPKYFFHNLHGTIHTTRQIEDKIICIVEPQMGSNFRIAVCDLNTKRVTITKTSYKNVLSVEGAFANFEL
ncbi:MAG: hypothetical protein A2329_01310 [Sulfurimonas sp. RIFOXYB2_FULL_37_5]|uniref:hypothetical protein n=1 Tax=Sulfurimonas sp. RIFOXYB12_FULL_35_9 TaxID=1802256 RepID=UPI0008AD7128|nr:hypothetical protein [Sulfurimonas sp. RIFOXYB12_FULL_35_9]OHE06542.1 MAG: hypothetical protein A2345_01250 [Sulfurimonas sp. RIFOXYB12_FULL_35_9]OHE12675.1 MAG: hypothetical protein A2329_01310 [Sulfurimonas sp. RIFOXYB2_FULL_37_5]